MQPIMLTRKRLMGFSIFTAILALIVLALIIWGIVTLVKKSNAKGRRGLLASGSAVTDDDSDCLKHCQKDWDACMKIRGPGGQERCDPYFIACQLRRDCSVDEPEEGDDSGPPKF